MPSAQVASDNLDSILAKIEEKFGKYQLKNFIFISIPAIFSGLYLLSFAFTARNLNYRCLVPECDAPVPEYKPTWLLYAAPTDRNKNPSRCERYPRISSHFNNSEKPLCPAILFNHTVTQICNEFVFDTDEVNILKEFGLMCDGNLWKLTLVGTINSIGQLICAPVAGYLADRFGRRLSIICSLLLSTVAGVLRSITPSYLWFLLLEFLDTALGSGAFIASFILAVELVPPDKRVLSSILITTCYATGTGLIGVIASTTRNWRILLRYLYIPGFFLVGFFWLTPESIRWLLAKGRHDEVKDLLQQAAKDNNIELTENELKSLECQPQQEIEQTESYPMRNLFKSRILLLRLFNCWYCWITCSLVYGGLSLISVSMPGNIYLNFTLAALIEIPGFFATYLILDRLGRRITLCGSLLLTGIACLSSTFISVDAISVRLAVFLVAKFGITIAFAVIYICTSELFPTPLRNSIMGACLMIGRIGTMTAPQVPLLIQIMESLPFILFGVMSVTSGLLVLFFPETLNTKLPDTIKEAEVIGQKEKEIVDASL